MGNDFELAGKPIRSYCSTCIAEPKSTGEVPKGCDLPRATDADFDKIIDNPKEICNKLKAIENGTTRIRTPIKLTNGCDTVGPEGIPPDGHMPKCPPPEKQEASATIGTTVAPTGEVTEKGSSGINEAAPTKALYSPAQQKTKPASEKAPTKAQETTDM